MDKIISSILDAEKKADEITDLLTEKAKDIVLSAEEKAEKIRESAILSSKAQKKKAIFSANEKAEEEYIKKINEGEKIAQAIYDNAQKNIDKVAEEIVKGFVK